MDLYLLLYPQFDGYLIAIGLVLIFAILLCLIWATPIPNFRNPPPAPPKSKTKQKTNESDDYKLAA